MRFLPLVLVTCLAACRSHRPAAVESRLWTAVPDSLIGAVPVDERPSAYRLLALDEAGMQQRLNDSGRPVDMPLPDGTLQAYAVYETATLDTALLARYPHLRTYGGRAVDEPSSTGRFDLTNGFHGYLLTPAGTIVIRPLLPTGGVYYICYYKHDAGGIRQPFEFPADSILHRE